MSEFADIISIITGIMTLLGFGGILSWSFVRESGLRTTENVISIFAKSLKIGLCVISVLVLLIPIQASHMLLIAVLGNGHFPNGFHDDLFWWQGNLWYVYLFSYLIGLLFWFPFCCLGCAIIYTWSLRPVYLLAEHFRWQNR